MAFQVEILKSFGFSSSLNVSFTVEEVDASAMLPALLTDENLDLNRA